MLCQRLASEIGLDVLLNMDFMLIAATRMCYIIAFCGTVVYMVPNALSLGLSAVEASFLTTAYGVGSLSGLCLSAILTQSKRIPHHLTGMISAVVTAVALGLESYISSFTGQMVNTFVIAAAIYAVIQVMSVLTRNLPFPDDRFVIVLGWLSFLSGVATAAGDTISGS